MLISFTSGCCFSSFSNNSWPKWFLCLSMPVYARLCPCGACLRACHFQNSCDRQYVPASSYTSNGEDMWFETHTIRNKTSKLTVLTPRLVMPWVFFLSCHHRFCEDLARASASDFRRTNSLSCL
jgi:hypothetical protein